MDHRLETWAAVLTAALAAGCGGDSSDSGEPSADSVNDPAVIDPGDGGNYSVAIEPARFTSVVDNPYMPMLPGSRWRYEETTEDGELETITVEVLDEHRQVMGVDAIVVHDVVTTAEGDLIEDTYDWYAQDADGNVWYFGEDTTAYEDGATSKEGSWEAGRAGALPGIVMPADPTVSDIGYRQEYMPGEAEDMGQIIADDGSITVPFGAFDDVIRTRDWTPLEPDVVEEKTYARDVGVVHEATVSPADAEEADVDEADVEEASAQEEVVLVEFTPGA